MPDPEAAAGILSLATYIPRAWHDADYIASRSETPAEIIRTRLGWFQKNVPGPGDGTVAMGLKAARKALDCAGLERDQIELVIWSGEEFKEYRNWPVGPKLQKELGLDLDFTRARLRGAYDHIYDDNYLDIEGTGTHYVVLGYEYRLGDNVEIKTDDQHEETKWMSLTELLEDPDVHPNTKLHFQ